MSVPGAHGAPEPGVIPERIHLGHLRIWPDHLARYRFALHWAAGARVLDVCCGTGYGSLLLAAAGAEAVTGVDIAEEAISEARTGLAWATAGGSGGQPPAGGVRLEFQVMDALELPYRAEFDLVTCFEGLEHVTDGERLMAGIARALRPGGFAIVSTPNAAAQPGGHSGNPYHVREYYPREFEELVRRHFGSSKIYYQRRNDPLDAPWSWVRAGRALLPAGLRRGLRRLWGSRGPAPAAPADPAAEEWLARQVDDQWYPRSRHYLGFPGMEPGFEPGVLIAVCRARSPGP